MKCHEVLGVEETASESSVELAYQSKLAALYSCEDSLPHDLMDKKAAELLTAKNDCIAWTSSSNGERLVMRFREKRNLLTNPNVMYASPIGFCSACSGGCCGAFEDDTCVECICGENSSDRCVNCTNKVDIGLYIVAGLAAIGGIISLIGKITPSAHTGKGDRGAKRQREAVAKNQELQSELDNALAQLKREKNEKSSAGEQYDRILAFSNFFTHIGCENCSDIIAREQSAVNDAEAKVNKTQNTVDRLQRQIQKNSRFIK